MRRIKRSGLCVSALLLAGAVGADPLPATAPALLAAYDFRHADRRTRLPKYLREISGLSVESNQQVVLHDDNSARIWRFDTSTGTLQETPVQSKPTKGDFEGIVRIGASLLLSTSHGTVLRFDSASTQPQQPDPRLRDLPIDSPFDLPFRGLCNFEGLAATSQTNGNLRLLLPCKYPKFREAGKTPAADHLIYIFRHSLTSTVTDLEPLAIDVTPILRAFRLPRLRPSAIETTTDRLLILAGKERVLLETTLSGELLAWRRLVWPRHRQAEGLTVMPDGTLVIADEGRWLGGTITSYRQRQPTSDRVTR